MTAHIHDHGQDAAHAHAPYAHPHLDAHGQAHPDRHAHDRGDHEQIVLALWRADELPVNALAEIVGKKPSRVSQHLARMRMARMVTTRQEDTSVLYRLADERAVALVAEPIKQAEHAVANGQIPPHHHAAQQ